MSATQIPNVTVHRYSKTEKPISVNGSPWGMARFNRATSLWVIKANDSKIETLRVETPRQIEFAVLAAVRAYSVEA